jgi:glutamate synthase domain-containing protein 2
MSDGSLSPEGTRTFVRGSKEGTFPINTGEGGLTSNFLITHLNYDKKYMTIVECSDIQKKVFRIANTLFNVAVATDIYRKIVFKNNPEAETYILDKKTLCFYRSNWDASLDVFPNFVQKHAVHIKNYHNNLLKNIRGLLAVMGLKDIKELNKDKLIFLDKNSRVHDNIDKVFDRRLDIGKE